MTETLPFQDKAVEESLGAFLAGVRQAKGVSLEKAAHETRIRAQRLREMESDDFSHFSHPSYSRMFLMDYAKYLGVPLSKIQGLLPEGGACGAAGYEYLQNMPDDAPAAKVRRQAPQRRGPIPSFAGVMVLVLLGLLAVPAWITVRNIGRLDLRENAEKAAAAPAATTETPQAAATLPAFEPQVAVQPAASAVEEVTPEAAVAVVEDDFAETEEMVVGIDTAVEITAAPDVFVPPAITRPQNATAQVAPQAPAPVTAPALDDHLFVDGSHGQNGAVRQ